MHLSHTCDFERWINYAEHRSQRSANQDAHTDSTQLRMHFEAQESYTCPDIALLKHLRPDTTHIRALIATFSSRHHVHFATAVNDCMGC
jgi:hypothetical protein